MPYWLWPVAAAPFAGSFLGTLVTRSTDGRSALWGRSNCDACRHTLVAGDLVPIASWLAAGRRCRYCGADVSGFYPAIEIGALLLAAWAASAAAGPQLWVSCALAWCLLALSATDMREGLLPDALTLPLAVAGLAAAAWQTPDDIIARLIGAAAGFVALAATREAYRHLRRRDGLGLGDAKLLGAGGAWVGWQGLPSVLLLACMATLGWVLLEGWWRGGMALDRRIPFGPGLCLGIWLVWLYGPLN